MPPPDLPDPSLSPVQEQVLAAIAAGASTTAAAAQAGVHRNTVANWRRSSQIFQSALAQAHYDRALQVHELAVALAGDAVAAIQSILNDPKTPPSVRLKAALAILQQAATPPPEPPATRPDVHKFAQVELPKTAVHPKEDPWLKPIFARLLHKTAQSTSPVISPPSPDVS